MNGLRFRKSGAALWAVFLCLFLSAWALGAAPLRAEPWIVTGQTALAKGTGYDNPAPSDPGALGQVTELPYVVPYGKVLRVDAYGIEGYEQAGVAVIFLWTGAPAQATAQWRIDHGAHSVAATDGSNETLGQKLFFPEGTVVNVRLINGTTDRDGSVFGWYVAGELLDAAP